MLDFLKRIVRKNNAAVEVALKNGAVILDVRTASEFREGHIEGAKNIPVNEIRGKLETIRKWNKPVITVCKSGSRSSVARSILVAKGLEVYNGGSWHSLQKIIGFE